MITLYEPSLLPVALDFGRKFHEESRYRDIPFSEEKIARLLSSPNLFCALAKSENSFIGGIFGLVQQSWFSEYKAGFDLGLYILPKYRGKSMAPIRLIKAFEDYCHAQGCSEITLSSSAKINENNALRLYEKLGYEKCGFITYKNISSRKK